MRLLVLVGLTVAVCAAGCLEESADGDETAGGALDQTGDGDDDAVTLIDDFSLGLTTHGDDALFQVRIDAAEPAPPQKYENDWMITVLDMDGEPVDGVELLFVEPFMPAHGHDGTFEPTVAAGSGPGEFAVDRINLWMGGDWEVRFFLKHGDDEDRVVVDVFIAD